MRPVTLVEQWEACARQLDFAGADEAIEALSRACLNRVNHLNGNVREDVRKAILALRDGPPGNPLLR